MAAMLAAINCYKMIFKIRYLFVCESQQTNSSPKTAPRTLRVVVCYIVPSPCLGRGLDPHNREFKVPFSA